MTRNGGDAHDEFADVRKELSAMPVPTADERLLARILESARRGRRVSLPVDDVVRRRRPVYWIGAVAAAIAAVFAFNQFAVDRGVASEGAFEGWFKTRSAYAQSSTAAPAYHGAHVTLAGRLQPMRLAYLRTVRAKDAVTTLDLTVSVARDVVGRTAAWRVVTTSRGAGTALQQDSAWVSASTFAPLRQVCVEAPYRKYDRIVIEQSFNGSRFRGDMKAFQGSALSAHRRVDRTLPNSFMPFVPSAFTPVFPSGIPIDRAWKGSFAVLGWAIRDNDVFRSVAMQVDGEENVRVPAGEFPCWRIRVDHAGGHRQWFWVRRSDGVGVRTLDSTDVRAQGVREIVLRSEERR